jgi:UDP-N-acetylglucosamine:LPS N-acetylglucosamine transferase
VRPQESIAARPKVCLVSSPGGHLAQIIDLSTFYSQYDHFFVIEKHDAPLPDACRGQTFWIAPGRRGWNNVVQLWEMIRILRRERPSMVVSCGAGAAVAAALVCRVLRIPMIFIETVSAVYRPTLAGRIAYPLCHHFFYQWPELQPYYPKGEYAGNIYGFCVHR